LADGSPSSLGALVGPLPGTLAVSTHDARRFIGRDRKLGLCSACSSSGNTLARLMLGTQVYDWMAGFEGDSHHARTTLSLPAWQRRRG